MDIILYRISSFSSLLFEVFWDCSKGSDYDWCHCHFYLPKFCDFMEMIPALLLESEEIESATLVQFLDEAVCILLHANALREGINPSVFPPAMDDYVLWSLFSYGAEKILVFILLSSSSVAMILSFISDSFILLLTLVTCCYLCLRKAARELRKERDEDTF